MTAGWVAAGVRGRGLLRRRLGRDGARRLASMPSLGAALGGLAETPYGRELRADDEVADAQHAISATALWHLRVLAGWGPPLGVGPLRLVAGGFEVADVTGRVLELSGGRARRPYVLGSLATAWPALSAARSASELRDALGSSPWGDPGSEELAAIRIALQLAWARRVFDGVPDAAAWAVAGAALLVGRVVVAGGEATLATGAARDATHLLGPHWRGAASVEDLVRHVPPAAARALDGVQSGRDLWRAEARWWRSVEAEAEGMVARPRPDASTTVGVAALLMADAWRVRAAIGLAGRGGPDPAEVFGDAA